MNKPIRSWIRGFWDPQGESWKSGIRSVKEFAHALAIERQRADRGNTYFSLVTFTPVNGCPEIPTLKFLVSALPGRLRMTDLPGWLDARRAAALLPDTPPGGAWKLADDVCRLFPKDVPAPVCAVLTYPAPGGLQPEPRDEDARAERPQRRAAGAMDMLFAAKTPAWKRALDVAGAAAGLIVLSPLFLIVAAAIKCTSRGPVIFSQLRSGHGGKPFRMYKFRSMVVDAEDRKQELMSRNEQDGPAFKVRNDPRVTPLGRILRKTSIDELPQLWNVLRGDMSLVGPRPLPCGETDGCDQWHRRRLDVTPGLTCIWQVEGRSQVAFDDWVRMDIKYTRSRKLWNDVKLILKTVPAVLKRNGAH